MDVPLPRIGIYAFQRSRSDTPQGYADVVVRGEPGDRVHALIACMVVGGLSVRHERRDESPTAPDAPWYPITVTLTGDRRPYADALTIVHHAIQAWRLLLESPTPAEHSDTTRPTTGTSGQTATPRDRRARAEWDRLVRSGEIERHDAAFAARHPSQPALKRAS
ncbi:hypothetical protein [Actinokineospora sp. HUAS TT18]|uniref:hypothetical protein n=1 Tax=Actinokineospora sp. HUAS TT18 TaxID=3447451 RepID=UPI003F5262B9